LSDLPMKTSTTLKRVRSNTTLVVGSHTTLTMRSQTTLVLLLLVQYTAAVDTGRAA
jgi:hypothetical protein